MAIDIFCFITHYCSCYSYFFFYFFFFFFCCSPLTFVISAVILLVWCCVCVYSLDSRSFSCRLFPFAHSSSMGAREDGMCWVCVDVFFLFCHEIDWPPFVISRSCSMLLIIIACKPESIDRRDKTTPACCCIKHVKKTKNKKKIYLDTYLMFD